jgi:hypothetical protein
MIAIQMPDDLDKAYQLDLFHEELGDGTTPLNAAPASRQVYHSPPMVQPPLVCASIASRVDRTAQSLIRLAIIKDNWTALQNYRRAKGLLFYA